jgi:hypothetical protein
MSIYVTQRVITICGATMLANIRLRLEDVATSVIQRVVAICRAMMLADIRLRLEDVATSVTESSCNL